jgi:hypothetical protein
MKTRFLTIALLLAVSVSGFAQDKKLLKEATQKMIDLKDQGEYVELSGTVYPKVFDVIPRDQYIDQQKTMYNAEDYTVHMIRIDPSIDYSAIEKDQYGTTFCLVNYTAKMVVELKKKPEAKELQAKEDYFKKLLGTESIAYNDGNNLFEVKKRVKVVAIADEATRQQWTFIDPTVPGVYDILPESVRMALNPENDPEQIPDGNTAKSDAKLKTESPQSSSKKAEQEKLKATQKKS